MLARLALILCLQLVGETLAQALRSPAPGPVIGMALLFLVLLATGGPDADLDKTASGFLDNLGLLFVPAGVGVTLHLSRAADEWPAIAAAVLGGTLLALVAVGWMFQGLARLSGRGGGDPRDG